MARSDEERKQLQVQGALREDLQALKRITKAKGLIFFACKLSRICVRNWLGIFNYMARVCVLNTRNTSDHKDFLTE